MQIPWSCPVWYITMVGGRLGRDVNVHYRLYRYKSRAHKRRCSSVSSTVHMYPRRATRSACAVPSTSPWAGRRPTPSPRSSITSRRYAASRRPVPRCGTDPRAALQPYLRRLLRPPQHAIRTAGRGSSGGVGLPHADGPDADVQRGTAQPAAPARAAPQRRPPVYATPLQRGRCLVIEDLVPLYGVPLQLTVPEEVASATLVSPGRHAGETALGRRGRGYRPGSALPPGGRLQLLSWQAGCRVGLSCRWWPAPSTARTRGADAVRDPRKLPQHLRERL